MGYLVISSFFYIFAKRYVMDKGIFLKKNKIYKLKSSLRWYDRDYLLFALKEDFYWSGIGIEIRSTFFTIDLVGNLNIDNYVGLWSDDTIEPLTVDNWLEVGQYLKNTNFRINLRAKELIEINKKKEELVLV